MQVVVSVREGTAPLTQACLDSFCTITSFAELSQEDPDSKCSPPKKPRLEGEGKGVTGDGEADGHKNGSEKEDKGAATERDKGGNQAVKN